MLDSKTLFGKQRETNAPNPPLSSNNSLTGVNAPSSPRVIPPQSSFSTQPQSPAPQDNSSAGSNSQAGSKLTVGPNIKLKGEITDCDTLVVEGRVEATMNSRVLQIAEGGAFIGTAEVDLAEIRGEFDGELTVRDKLVIYSTGKVSGKIRYGKLVIEEGGHLTGDVQVGNSGNAVTRGLAVAKL
jgi:cytoskeletal protein CcmA (bactofilin family)